MSYDLYFTRARPLDLRDVREYFEGLGFQVNDKQAFFENESTGVYYSFDFTPEGGVAFNINYYRPHVFGLEAARMLTEFVEHFGLEVDDPQANGMGKGPFTAAGFLRGWNSGNEFAHRAIATNEGVERPLTLPAERSRGAWQWNFAKEAMLEELMDLQDELPPCFIPTVMMVVATGSKQVKTCVVWDLQMAIAIPEVDLVLSTAGRGLLAARCEDVLAAVHAQAVWERSRAVGGDREIGIRAHLVDELDAAASARMKALMTPFEAARVTTANVLDEELVAVAFAS